MSQPAAFDLLGHAIELFGEAGELALCRISAARFLSVNGLVMTRTPELRLGPFS
jgi:hypothetical protein